MSITPTAGSATAKRSGRCCWAAPTSSPPFDPPMIPSFAGDVYFSFTRYSATAMKSSNTFCFFSRLPALCHASPYSAPPRMLTVTQMPPTSSHAGTSPRQVDIALRLAVEAEERQSALHVHQILGDHAAADERDGLDRLLRLRDDRLPRRGLWIADIERHDLAVGRLAVGPQIQRRSLVTEREKLGVVFFDQRFHSSTQVRPLRIAEVRVVETVAVVGSFRHRDQQVPAVLCGCSGDEPCRQIFAFVDQRVCRLRRTDAVVVKRLSRQGSLEHFALRRFRVARKKKALRVPRP